MYLTQRSEVLPARGGAERAARSHPHHGTSSSAEPHPSEKSDYARVGDERDGALESAAAHPICGAEWAVGSCGRSSCSVGCSANWLAARHGGPRAGRMPPISAGVDGVRKETPKREQKMRVPRTNSDPPQPR